MITRLAAALALLALASGCRQILGIDDKGCPPEVVRSDPKNCGACGHDCLGGACVEGACQPVVIGEGQGSASGLAVGREHVFWGDEAKVVWRARKDGSEAPVLVGGQGLALEPVSLAIDETHVYWATYAKTPTGEVARAAIDDGPIEPLTTGWSQLSAVRIAQDDVFFLGAVDTTILVARVGKHGGSAEPRFMQASKNAPDFGALVSDTGSVYFVTDAAILRLPMSEGDAVVVHEDAFGGRVPLAVDETHVYWGFDGALQRKRKDGSGAAETLASAAVGSLAVDATHVYWLNLGAATGAGTSSIQRIAKDGGEPELLHFGVRGAGEIALDEDAVYFTVAGEGTVRKLAK